MTIAANKQINHIDFMVRSALNIPLHPWLGQIVAPADFIYEGRLENQPGLCISATHSQTKGITERHIFRRVPTQAEAISEGAAILIADEKRLIPCGYPIDLEGEIVLKDWDGIHRSLPIIKATTMGLVLVQILVEGLSIRCWLAPPEKRPETFAGSAFKRLPDTTGYRARQFYLGVSTSSSSDRTRSSVFDGSRRNRMSFQDWNLKAPWEYFDLQDEDAVEKRFVFPLETVSIEGHEEWLLPFNSAT